MPVHMTHGRQLPPFGVEPNPGYGWMAPAAQQLGLGALSRHPQPGRLHVAEAPPAAMDPSMRFEYRLMDPRTLDATRVLDAGAPAVRQLYEISPMELRPTEAPIQYQRTVPMGGRRVLVLPPSV